MTPTLGTALPPPAATGPAPASQPAASPQPADNKEEFSQALAGARGRGRAARAPADAPDDRVEAPPAGKTLPPVAASETQAAIPADDDTGAPDGSPTDRGDPLLAWMDALSAGTAAITPPAIPPAPVAGTGPAGSLQPESADGGPAVGVSSAVVMPGFSASAGLSPAAGGADFSVPIGTGASSAALSMHDAAARSPWITAPEMLPGTEQKVADARDLPPFPAVSPATTALHGGDAPGAPPPGVRAADAAAPQPSVEPPVGQAGWGRELGSRVLWLAKDNQQYAELHLNPPNLGPLEVRIALHSDQGATISFLSNHAAVRDAVADAVPQLRDLFAEGGFTALDVSVSHQSGGGHSQATPHAGTFAADAQENAAAVDNEDDGQRRLLHTGHARLVDYFA